MVLQSADTQVSPILTGNCAVYGKVVGDVRNENPVPVEQIEW